MLTKTALQKLWQETKFKPNKRFGQNFLIDKNLCNKIIENLNIARDDTVLEIGPGFGEMTDGLGRIAKKVYAVEKDKRITSILREKITLPPTIEIVEGDFLKKDIKTFTSKEKLIVYGNLPYYITTPILEKLFKRITLIKDIYLVMQKEVADRITASPGSKNIGRLSLFAQYFTQPKRIFKIAKQSFYPMPKVDSFFVRLKPLAKPPVSVKNSQAMFNLIKMAYGKRRKTLTNSLREAVKDKKDLLPVFQASGINKNARAEELSLEDFARISNYLEKETSKIGNILD